MSSDLEHAATDIAHLAHFTAQRIADREIEASFTAFAAIRRHVDKLELLAYEHWRSTGLTYDEIGDPIGVPRPNVYRRYKLLRDK